MDAARAAAIQTDSSFCEDIAPGLPGPGESKYSLTARQVMEIEAQARILKLEKDAESARLELARLRTAEYGHATS